MLSLVSDFECVLTCLLTVDLLCVGLVVCKLGILGFVFFLLGYCLFRVIWV